MQRRRARFDPASLERQAPRSVSSCALHRLVRDRRGRRHGTIDAEKYGLCGGDPSKKDDFKDARLIP